ncbi:MAG: tyrosine-type recombinase/integrase [Streptosporangiaceae bacterium]
MESSQRAGHPSRIQVSGPLAPYAAGWRAELAARGFARHSVLAHAQLMAHLSGWMITAGHDAGSLTGEVVTGYLQARRAAGYRARTGGRALAPLLGYLRGLGVVPQPAAAPPTPAEALLAEFCGYLAGERGLAAGTVRRYARFARVLITGLGITGEADLAAVTAADIAAFTVGQASRRNPADMQGLVTAVRSVLRFLHVTGRVRARLDAAVPSAPGRRATSLPRGIAAGQAAALLASCDRDSAAGQRDYAILALLTRMGLRAGEVTSLTLDDIDWRAGELMVRGKGDDHARLPLPADAGEAVAGYLRFGRARTADRHLFVTVRAPFTGLARNTSISGVVRQACLRAGIKPFGPHRLRHAVACDLLADGASLEEIGQLLRHRSQRSTAIYAKADIEALRALARPCPAAGPGTSTP